MAICASDSRLQEMKLELIPKRMRFTWNLTEAEVEKSTEIQPGIVLNYDAEGRVVGIEVLYVSQRSQSPLKKAA
jgi:hypothetical protein